MFSSRTNWNTVPNPLAQLLEEKRLRGETITDLTESNPTRCGFSYHSHKILATLADPSALVYQPEPRGLLSARIAIAKYYSTFNVAVDPEQIVLTASTSEAYTFLLKLLCDVGDEVIVPKPSYPLFEYLCRLNDVKLQNYRLVYDGEWHIDFESLQAGLTEHTRAIIIVQPNNPTGSYLKQDEFDRICQIASEHNCAIIADEVFGPFAYAPDSRRANIFLHSHRELFFSLNGISKLLGLPQLKLSWIIIGDTSEQASEALNRLDIIADTFLSVNTPVQAALPELFQQSQETIEQIRTRVCTNYNFLQKTFRGSSISVFRIEGGWYAILQLPREKSDDDWALEILMSHNILVYPGHFFDLEHESCIVVSQIVAPILFEDVLLKIRRLVDVHS